MKKICIVNAHWSNRGDEAALRPIINSVKEEYPNTEITVIFKDRKEVQQFPYDGNIKHFSAQYLPENLNEILDAVKGKTHINDSMMKMIETLKKMDLIIYSPGGAVISDKFWWKKQIEYLVPFICAKEYGIPIVVAAPSMGPFDDDKEKNYWRRLWLSKAKVICIRESISAGYLQKLGLENVITTIDTAFYDDPDQERNGVLLEEQVQLSHFMKSHKKVVAVTLSDFSWHVEHMKKLEKLEKQKEVMRRFLESLRQDGYGILLVPQLFGNQNDSSYLEQFIGGSCYLLSDQLDTYFQQYIISKCYAVVGMRYHSNVFAAKMGVPFVAIGYEEKMYGFMEQWSGLSDYLIKLDDLDEEHLQEKWRLLEANHQTYHDTLCMYREMWRHEASKTICTLLREIENITLGEEC